MGLIVLTGPEWTALTALREHHPECGVTVEWSPRTDRTLATVELDDGRLAEYEIVEGDAVLRGTWCKTESAEMVP